MGLRSLLGGLDEMSFKRAPEGWIFQAPSLLGPLRPSSHYIVNDAQKAAISAQLRRMWTWTLVLIVIAAGFAPILDNNFGPGAPGGMVGKIVVYGAIMIALTFAILLWHMRAIRPLLEGARPTKEQISIGDRLRTQAHAAATWYLAIIELAMLLFCVTAAISMFAADTWLVFAGWLFVLCFFAVLAVYYARLLMLKHRQRVTG
jgi:hypothetical protein